jgi:SdpC family antimicrobial peptide
LNVRRVIAAGAVAAAVIGGVATTTGSATADSAARATVSAEDGRALFAGLVFGQGKAGDALAEAGLFQDPQGLLEKNDTAEGRKGTALVADAIADRSPGFFTKFSADLRSGDPRRVDGALDAARGQLNGLAEEDKLSTLDTGPDCAAVNVVLAVNAVTGVNVVNAAAVFNVVTFWFAPPQSADELGHEEAVAEITAALRTV